MARLKSCKYCGKIHLNNIRCEKAPASTIKRRTEADIFRSGKRWRVKREEIKRRDKNLCQICIRDIYNTLSIYTYNDLAVHHIIPLDKDLTRGLDNDNLITLCTYHHELAERHVISPLELFNITHELNINNNN